LNFTAATPVKPAPPITTCPPALSTAGVSDAMVNVTVKLVALTAEPSGVVTVILPVVAPFGTLALITVAVALTISVTVTSPNFTVGDRKPEPLLVTVVPTGPEAGVKPVIFVNTTNGSGEVAVPPGVVNVTTPVVAAAGTVVFTVVAFTNVNGAATPLNFTDETPLKVVPVNVTGVPTKPLATEKPEIVDNTLNAVALVASPPGVVTFTNPVVAVAGTWVVIDDPSFDSIGADTPLNVNKVAPRHECGVHRCLEYVDSRNRPARCHKAGARSTCSSATRVP
jgi:hypothetical protein